jgi:tetratricopeptide (TPR) repeat protein
MKRIERRHLKENELASTLANAREFLEPRRKQITTTIVVLAVLVVAVLGVTFVRQRSRSRGQELLAQAMVALNARVVPAQANAAQPGELPAAASFGATGTFATEDAKLTAALPKLKAAADAYPESDAGITARYHLAGALAALGRHAEAITEFDSVEKRAGHDSLYGRMARLGKADEQARAGQIDTAIATWKEIAGDANADLPKDAILIELARAYVQKGNTDEAKKAFNEIVEKHPDSPYVPEARTELDNLKS